MDSITQAALGASLGGVLLGRQYGRKALVAGAVLATLPDLDVFIPQVDRMTAMVNHRGFSHSLVVLTGLSLLMAWLWHRWRQHDSPGPVRLFVALWLILATHPLLDAFTAYGTQLWWPWMPTPAAWSSVFIIDPLFTLPLLAGVLVSLALGSGERTRRTLALGLGFGAAYLSASLVAKQVVEHRVTTALAAAGTPALAVFSTPQPFSILLWRVVARVPDDHYVEAVVGLLDRRPPEQVRLPLNSTLPGVIPPEHPLTRLRWFTDDWLRYDNIDGRLVVTDLRMGVGTGHYSFRFVVAQRDDAHWQWQTPLRWPTPRPTDLLGQVLRRSWQSEPPLPLAEWEAGMH